MRSRAMFNVQCSMFNVQCSMFNATMFARTKVCGCLGGPRGIPGEFLGIPGKTTGEQRESALGLTFECCVPAVVFPTAKTETSVQFAW
jgi:hypothetical protein